jgi:general secretion pathway protein M
MSAAHPFDRYLARYPNAAVIAYVAVVAAFIFTTWVAVADIVERREAVRAGNELLAQLEGRRPSLPESPGGALVGPAPTGSPFLEGDTVTVAGAALLQRVAGAVTRVGGNVLSSQVDVKGPQSTDGYVSLIVSCEIEQSALQQVLYDLEAGMPFLFIEQVVAQGAQAALTADAGRMRLLLVVAGQWQGAK